jgi:4-carboxymuconolactone decarboxylase
VEANERRARGEAMYREVVGRDPPEARDPYTGYGVLDTVFSELWTRSGLTRKERRLITLSCVGAASSTGAIEAHLRAALDSGDLTLVEVEEFILHFAFYAGWPKAATFETALGAYQAERRQPGADPAGR